MAFEWPNVLWCLLLVPLLVGAYVALERRRRRNAIRLPSLAVVRESVTRGQAWRRHLPPALILAAFALLIVAAARPAARITLPSDHRTIVLAIDVSLSMRANDIEPTRLAAAQVAAKNFVEAQPPDVRVALVSFAGSGAIVQAPTRNRADLIAAIDRLELQRHTATGTGILTSLAALFPDEAAELTAANSMFGVPGAKPLEASRTPEAAPKAAKKTFVPVPPGSNLSAAIILLTDGRRTVGPDPIEAARKAAERGVRVYTVGFGTAEGASVTFDGWSIFMRFDEEALKAIADVTRATYFHAKSSADLKSIYEQLNARYVLERRFTEVAALFSALAAIVVAIAVALSLRWFRRIA